ncbi:S-adenosylmethionine:tRNA ribosyltransferase-isomerase [Paenibacillus cymbidii]|uniref:S-adenosylmethionine:tRNA ribosyltransferase-isomerase n=1 Tax=Paenibacillus cymbidii TaxID=1639034 RepID=UPI00108081BE|nr:S-adenosylmethionine:tRNA ribosyltransferase-isomerase [Paenibacillus cymbidii]
MTIAFELPSVLHAPEPPEVRGLRRDGVRLLTTDRRSGESGHSRFYELDCHLRPGDVIVVNASRTMPAVLQAQRLRGGNVAEERVEVRLSHLLGAGSWEALVLAAEVEVGDTLRFAPSLSALVAARTDGAPTFTLQFSCSGPSLYERIYALGEPVRYEYARQPWALDYYQTVFAAAPGSVEMPSAGRAFSWQLIRKLRKRGIGFAFIELHAGLSYWPYAAGSPDGEQPHPRRNAEPYAIPAATAEAVNGAKAAGGRIIAVGTTVVRTLETAATTDGFVRAGSGRTNLYIDRHYPLRVVDGLLTGFHEPEASHLELLSAFAAPADLERAYREAIANRYLWHEFGDMHLLL